MHGSGLRLHAWEPRSRPVQFASEDGTALRAANSPTEFATGVLGEDFVAVSTQSPSPATRSRQRSTLWCQSTVRRASGGICRPPSSSSSDELPSWATTATVILTCNPARTGRHYFLPTPRFHAARMKELQLLRAQEIAAAMARELP